jgi:hypothetical protein
MKVKVGFIEVLEKNHEVIMDIPDDVDAEEYLSYILENEPEIIFDNYQPKEKGIPDTREYELGFFSIIKE